MELTGLDKRNDVILRSLSRVFCDKVLIWEVKIAFQERQISALAFCSIAAASGHVFSPNFTCYINKIHSIKKISSGPYLFVVVLFFP